MKLSVPTNWDTNLVEELAKIPEVIDIYGKKPHDIVGGGRPHFFMQDVTDDQVADYVKLVHSKNMTFSYLLNAPCMNNMEYNPEYHKKILDCLQWISDIGIDGVTLTIPFLVQLVKEQFPKLKVRISVIAHVNSVNRAKFYEAMGADEINNDIMINRDFTTLEKMRNAVKCEIIPIVTDGCLYQCPFRYYHYNTVGHASQTYQQFDRNYIDFCIVNCNLIKFSNPTELVKCRFIRPEDLTHYEAIGIDHFKLGGRIHPTPWILRATNAYANRKWDGNLLDIIEGISITNIENENDPENEYWSRINTEKEAGLYLDNTKLDGFIDFFKTQNCIAMCDECNYCATWGEKAVSGNPEGIQKYIDGFKEYNRQIVSSEIFGLKEPKVVEPPPESTGMEWNEETKQIFEMMIGNTPAETRPMARIVISSLSEKNARMRGSDIVETPDMVSGFIEGCPPSSQADLKAELKKYGLWDEPVEE